MTVSVVTGGAGFIGSHLTTALSEAGYQVCVLDSLVGAASQRRAERLARLPGVEIVQGDIRDAALCRKVLFEAELVFHHAAEVSVPRSIEDPAACVDINLAGTINLLEAARGGTVRRFIFASSCAVYGDTPGAVKSETSALDPLSPYASSKLAGEYFCRNFFQLYELETVCLRYFNVYGPDQDPDGAYAAVIPKFITALLKAEQPVVYGTGEQSRDFVYVGDVVQANLCAANAPAQAVGGSFNIGSGRSVSLNRILEMLAHRLDRVIDIDRKPARAGDIQHSRADISAAELLKFKPAVPIEDGLARTLHWYQSEETNSTVTEV